jgi:hypothetical protein
LLLEESGALRIIIIKIKCCAMSWPVFSVPKKKKKKKRKKVLKDARGYTFCGLGKVF